MKFFFFNKESKHLSNNEQKPKNNIRSRFDTSLHRHSLSNLKHQSASSDVIIYAFDQKPAGSDDGNEWVTPHNPSNVSVDIVNWIFESTHGSTAIDWIAEGTTLYPGAYCTYTPFYRWLNNSEEAIILKLQMTRNS